MQKIRSLTIPALLVVILFLCRGFVFANGVYYEISDDEKWEIAERHLFFEEYDKAISIYKQLLETKPGNHNISYKIAFAKLKSGNPDLLTGAIDFFKYASENTGRFTRNSPRCTRSPINVYHYLGIAYELKNDHNEAQKYFDKFNQKAGYFDKKSIELNPRELWQSAELSLAYENYRSALKHYKKLLEYYPENHHFNFKLGFIYLISEELQDIEKARDYLNFAAENTTKRFKNRFRTKKAPHYTNYYLGVTHMLEKDYEKALEIFLEYQENMGFRESRSLYADLVDRDIKTSQKGGYFVREDRMKTPRIRVEGLQKELIRCPVFSEDAGRLIFTYGTANIFPRDLNFYHNYDASPFDDIYIAQFGEDGIFHSPINISEDLDIRFPHLPVSVTADGNELYLVVDEGDNGQIYMSRFEDGKYQKARPVNALNSRRWESHASITADGSRIYFTSGRSGSFGELDIWYADRNETGQWGRPQNLGEIINTPFKEEMPYISRDGKKLFFSSEGHINFGGFSMFFSKYDEELQEWTTPENLGYPYSTTGNDMGYFVEIAGGFMFCPVNDSKRREGIYDNECICLLEEAPPILADISGIVKPENDEDILPDNTSIKVFFHETEQKISETILDQNGNFEFFELLPGDYSLIVYTEFNELKIHELNIPENTEKITDILILIPGVATDEYIAAKKEAELKKIFEDAPVVEAVFFDFDRYEVLPKYFENLQIIAKYLRAFPEAKILLTGHTDHFGPQEYNLILSKNRAEAVKKYLVEVENTDASQISTSWRGKLDLITIDTYDDNIRRLNRRVEIKLIEDGKIPIIIKPISVPREYQR